MVIDVCQRRFCLDMNVRCGSCLFWARVRRVALGSVVCCCIPSETCGINGVIQIFRSFYSTVSSTTGGWSRWNT